MLNAARSVTYAANYDPYGQVMAQYLPDATPSFGFTGQMTDASGLQYLRARYYEPSTGTFLSQDPKIGAYPQLSASWNGYNYAHGNPTTLIDPSGEIPLLFAAAVFVGGTIIGGVSYGAWDVSVEQGIGLGGHNQFNFGAINWGQAGGAFRTGANTGMAVSSFFTGLRTSYTAARMGAGAGRYLASHTALDFGLGVAGDMVINGDSVGEAALWNAAGFVGGEVVGAGVALAGRGVQTGLNAFRSVRHSHTLRKNIGRLLERTQEVQILGFVGGGRRLAGEHPLLGAGHFGISWDGGRNIYGFWPTPYVMKNHGNLVETTLRNEGLVPGGVQNDTSVFRRAYELASTGDYPTTVYTRSQFISPKHLSRIQTVVEQGGVAGKFNFYAWPRRIETSDGILKPIKMPQYCNNCWTFVRNYNLWLPEMTGQVKSRVMPAFLRSRAAPWQPPQ